MFCFVLLLLHGEIEGTAVELAGGEKKEKDTPACRDLFH